MAIHAGPDTTDSNIIFQFDARNTRSYPGSGSVLSDLASQFSGSTLTNGAVYSQESYGSILFDGTNDNIETPIRAETYVPALSSWSMACWIKVTNFPTGGATNREGMVFGSAYYSGTGIYFSCTPAGDFRVRGYIRGQDQNRPTSNYSLVLNKAHNLCIVNDRSDTTFKLYMDGVLRESITGPSQQYNPSLTVPPNFENIRMNKDEIDGGGVETYTYFQGYGYQASIYNKALSASEVLLNYTALRGRFEL
jgi:hypothetical protein